MTEQNSVAVTLLADVNQVDQTGYVWAFLSEVAEPGRVRAGALVVAGDLVEPFLARVVEVIEGPDEEPIVRLDVVGVPDQAIDELGHPLVVKSRPNR